MPSIKKFRAWDKKHCKYTKVLKIYFGSDGSNLGALVEDYETNYAFELQANQVEFEQFTGLKDKNGKEIYEGDIVKDTSDGDCLINAIFWCEKGGFWGVKPRSPFADRDWGWFIGREDIEVIGNIHEPPKDFRPEHLKRMGVSISKGGEK